ncbi:MULTISPECIES: hypothetical protein [unclassified Leptolyngbya]|uniref:hypothetical protein n=1 Tax=unclassified Leptolyngbya TaxID=2650499 RepID=UPI001682A8DB|nr:MULTISPECIES: hypothetical protein [unclassified Leptolyngbya]MBD1914191.1 hypothetical protein [Leptolyngbya sp. FACHB-8]MBD2157198.1 hypothetical protein [Leptolyngbya sp. FACHB-16]
MTKKASASLSIQAILIVAIAWAVISLMFFLLFSVPLPGQGRPIWYNVTTYILENLAFLGAGLLCFRNWRSSQIVSGRVVWLLIGLGMISFFIGNLILFWWEVVWGKSPDVSPGDFFFLLMYVLVGIGMWLAITSRKLNLTLLQWLLVLGIAVAGAGLSYVIYNGVGSTAALLEAPAIAQEVPATTSSPAPFTAPPNPSVAPTPAPIAPAADAPQEENSNIPGWANAMTEQLEPFSDAISVAYVAGDLLLLMAASSLLLAFWGGRFSLSWRFIAAGALCFYIADTWFLYATTYITDYQTGALPEVFWIFSACLFAMGAALEYDLSGRSRRTSRRRG